MTMLTRRTLLHVGLAATPAVLAACGTARAAQIATATTAPTVTPTVTPTPLPVVARPAFQRVLLVGDSLTFGEGASRPNVGYAFSTVMALRARGKGAGAYYLLHGISGITTSGMLSFMDALDSGETADLVILELGTNDIVGSTPLSDFRAQYARLLARLRANSPTALIVGLTCWHDPQHVTRSGSRVGEYNAIIANTLAQSNDSSAPSRCVNLAPLYRTPWYHHDGGDTFHPNDDGHAAIAQAILAVV